MTRSTTTRRQDARQEHRLVPEIDGPTDQQTNRPTEQQSNRPTEQQTNRATDQQSNRPTGQQTNRPTDQQSNETARRRDSETTDRRRETTQPESHTFQIFGRDDPTNRQTDGPRFVWSRLKGCNRRFGPYLSSSCLRRVVATVPTKCL